MLLNSPAINRSSSRPGLNDAPTELLLHSSPSIYDSQTTHPLSCDYTTLGLAGIPDWVDSTLPHSVEESSSAEIAPGNERMETTGIDPATPWMISPSHQIPGWLVGEDFDMSALNAQIFPPSFSMDSFELSSHGFLPRDLTSHVNDVVIQSPKTNDVTQPRDEYIRRHWFTHLGTEKSGYVTPDPTNEPTRVDERYRENLSRQLQQRVVNEPLPSTDFLVSNPSPIFILFYFIYLFFRYLPSFPLKPFNDFAESMYSNVLYKV